MSEKLRQRVESQVEFQATSPKSFTELVELVQMSAAASKRMLQTNFKVKESETGESILVVAYGPGGFVEQMRLLVTHDEASGTVQLDVGDFITSRPTIFGFIPFGPKAAPALGPAKRFSTAFRQGL